MSSGRRETVMLFSISPLSKLYLEPVVHYEPDQVHVFIGNGDDAVSALARDVYGRCKGDMACEKVTEHPVDDSNYNDVLGSIIEVINGLRRKYGDDLDIFINISSGTPEFSAAGMFASMVSKSSRAFKVDAGFGMTAEELSDIAGALEGSMKVSDPELVTGLRNDSPDDEMVTFLGVVAGLLRESKYPKYRAIIERLKDVGAWSYDPQRKSGSGKTPLEEKEERYLKRHYIAVAVENGWLERPTERTMRITDSGKAYISVFTPERERVCFNAMPNLSVDAPDLCMTDEIRSPCPEALRYDEDGAEENEVTFVSKGKRYRFSIRMDRHSQHPGHSRLPHVLIPGASTSVRGTENDGQIHGNGFHIGQERVDVRPGGGHHRRIQLHDRQAEGRR